MACRLVALPGGIHAYVCGRFPTRRCSCGGLAEFQCDAQVGPRGRTCDCHICVRCAQLVGEDRHHCPTHRNLVPAPISGDLFPREVADVHPV